MLKVAQYVCLMEIRLCRETTLRLGHLAALQAGWCSYNKQLYFETIYYKLPYMDRVIATIGQRCTSSHAWQVKIVACNELCMTYIYSRSLIMALL